MTLVVGRLPLTKVWRHSDHLFESCGNESFDNFENSEGFCDTTEILEI